jgi:hypothetical protein
MRPIDADSIKYTEERVCHGHGLYFTEETVTKEEIEDMPTILISQNDELQYYKNICDLQQKYITGNMSKEELDSKCEIERLEYISRLNKKNLQIQKEIESQKRMTAIMEKMWEN